MAWQLMVGEARKRGFLVVMVEPLCGQPPLRLAGRRLFVERTDRGNAAAVRFLQGGHLRKVVPAATPAVHAN